MLWQNEYDRLRGTVKMGQILRTDNIKKAYGDKKVLHNINITLNKGELVSILGVSGVGKTTLFNVLSGLAMPDEGSVFLYKDSGSDYNETDFDEAPYYGTDSSKNNSKSIQNNSDDSSKGCINITGKTGYLSYMLQKDLLLPHKTVIENVALPLLLNKMPKKKALKMAEEHFEQFGLSGAQKSYPAELSGGMRQRAALLRTYLCNKEVALLDEPFSALDTITRASMQEWYLSVMREIKLSTLFITHDMDEAILLSDRIYIMKGSPATIADEIVIKEPRPRTTDFTLTDSFLDYKRRIRGML